MAVESLDLREESDIERVLIEDSNRIVGVSCRDELIVGISNRLQVPRRYVTGHTNDRKILGHKCQ
jgi:hypothetical protein